jgi:hypothetical protein
MSHRTADQRLVVFGGASGFAAAQSGELGAAALRDTWERPFDDAGSGSQPQPQPQPGTVEVVNVAVQPDVVSGTVGSMADVTVTFSAPTTQNTAIEIGIFYDDGNGMNPSQPQGFDYQSPQMIAPGISATQFQITRNGDPIPGGAYAVGVGVQGGQMLGGSFTLGP